MSLPLRRYRQAPYDGMSDALDPTTATPSKALLLRNCYPVPGPAGVAVIGRPGFQQLGAQLGSGANRRVQAVQQFTRVAGTEYTVAFCGGLMYTLDWSARTWTNVPLVGVSLSPTARIRCVPFADQLIVSDGVNRPWAWNGVTFTDLTNAPVAYGPPFVYYGKLGFVKNADRRTFVWSEENAPNTGYEAGGFNNVWPLVQTGTGGLERMLGTNEALYYWRARSLGRITGAVTPDFATAGTREGVSETIGTTAPDAVAIYDDVIYFLSADGQPFRMATGGGLDPIWEDLRETAASWPKSSLPSALGTIYPPAELVLQGVVELGQSDCTRYAAIDHRGGRIAGLWDGWTATALGLVKDQAQNLVLLHGTSNGYVYDHGAPDGSTWNDQATFADGGTQAIAHAITGSALGYAVEDTKAWERLDLTFRLDTALTGVQMDYETPTGLRPPTPLTFSLPMTGFLWDVSLWDAANWAETVPERHKAIGVTGRSRWLRPRVRHQQTTERFALLAVEASGRLLPASPEAA